MDRFRYKYQHVFCGAFLIGAMTLGIFSHENVKQHENMSALKGSFQSFYENGFNATNPLRQASINTWGALKYAVFGQASKGAVIGHEGWLFTTEELVFDVGYLANLDASVLEITRVDKELTGHGVKLMPVIVPDKARVYPEKLKHDRNAYLGNRYDMFLTKLKEHKVTAVSALVPLKRNKVFGDVFMRDDTHWSPLGAKAVADHITQYFPSEGFEKVNVKTQKSGAEVFDGDLLKYVPMGAFRPYIGPAQSTIDRFETTVQSNASLFGDISIDVVLVGTSFSAKPDWHFEGFLKQSLSVDVLNMSQEGKGPFVPMRDYLKSEAFKNTPPKLIIWEIPERYVTQDLLK